MCGTHEVVLAKVPGSVVWYVMDAAFGSRTPQKPIAVQVLPEEESSGKHDLGDYFPNPAGVRIHEMPLELGFPVATRHLVSLERLGKFISISSDVVSMALGVRKSWIQDHGYTFNIGLHPETRDES